MASRRRSTRITAGKKPLRFSCERTSARPKPSRKAKSTKQVKPSPPDTEDIGAVPNLAISPSEDLVEHDAGEVSSSSTSSDELRLKPGPTTHTNANLDRFRYTPGPSTSQCPPGQAAKLPLVQTLCLSDLTHPLDSSSNPPPSRFRRRIINLSETPSDSPDPSVASSVATSSWFRLPMPYPGPSDESTSGRQPETVSKRSVRFDDLVVVHRLSPIGSSHGSSSPVCSIETEESPVKTEEEIAILEEEALMALLGLRRSSGPSGESPSQAVAVW
jgi:hypothetical protein